MDDGNTWLNALIGAIVTVVSAPFFPLSPVVGGGVAGYLSGGDLSDGAIVGAIAGGIALLPLLLVLSLFGGVALLGPTVGFPTGFAALALFLFVLTMGLITVYVLGFSALGGVLGVYLATETDLDL